MIASSDLIAGIEALTDLIADKVEARMRRPNGEWIEQTGSPLGPRVHVAAVKRRVIAGEPGARIDNRRYYLTPEALQEELARRHGKSLEKTVLRPTPVTKSAAKNDMLALLRSVRTGNDRS